ncbi:hypothetical protein EMIHUDRAFT_114865 [Emiliania huxleyi CCMP1516]|uniref:FIST domain-containing protein n=2 Tax=Emiliania huxleyi TaxID=2903 RepID=A0A0D3JTQ8_EMIH1|nr:hypothetical protein EMIHUDRAFT_114865 [Emiliania huxleyi CCMP1516]EOD26893.1 hypothetical protein EMIHUDRAFT_114865 [Emiliania huxleyi CCMP1516]|eukprot:XP_005779322.1 hypothetical protein EMIHUDRAFT_114865 [Emiliania huxleyi CCMP1516]
MRLSSLTACGPGAAAELASKVRALQADAVFWLTESSQPAELAVALADSAESVVGAVTTQGLIGGGGEHSRSLGSASMPGVPYSFSPSPEAERTVALAISGLSGGASMLPWHSPPDGLPDLPEAFWTDHAVGGLTVGDSRFFVGATEHDGGGVGLALCGVDLEPLGARPVGPSFSITESDGNVIRALDGMEVTAALEPVLKEFSSAKGDLMAGASVPGSLPPCHPARQELRASAAALAAATGGGAAPAGGLMVPRRPERGMVNTEPVPCVGRGAALYGEEGVESAVLQQSMGSLALADHAPPAGFFAGGEIGPVGARTFVHTYTTTVGLLRARS